MGQPDSTTLPPCPVEGCANHLTRLEDLVCTGDFTVLAGVCRGKQRLGQPVADSVQDRGFGIAYQCVLCRQWHNGNKPARHADLKTLTRAIIRALRADERCGSTGLLNLADAWHPRRVNRDSWCLGLDQREAYALA